MGFITSKFDGFCKGCGRPTFVGDQVWWTQGVKGVKCQRCVIGSVTPQGAPTTPLAAQLHAQLLAQQAQLNQHFANQTIPQWAIPLLPTSPPVPVVVKSSLPQLIATALVALEEVILESAMSTGMSPELKSGWEKYQKLKASALRPGSTTEEKQAFKLALIQALKLAPLT